MGIPGLWDILGDGDVTTVIDLSTEHYKRTGRPFRVAIDEAGWRFNNLNDFQVAKIREKQPLANPIEKAILWRLLRLMRMNIQPIFIFDGPSRPWKRGGTAGRIDWKKIDLLRKLLDVLKIPHHRAPAEAEAECARLNDLGIVDAVWTDDGDALMFGARVLIKDYREAGSKTAKKSDTLIRIYRMADIEQKHRIDRQGLILFALLSGGDYDTKGLPGCGPKAALAAAKFDHGRLGRMLCETPLRQLHCFTESLREYFQRPSGSGIYVPPGYPRDLHVKNYREPKVSTLEQAHNLRGLKHGWDVQIDETKLRPFLLEKFDFWTQVYIKHVLPVLLTKALLKTPPDGVKENHVFNIEIVSKGGQDPNQPCKERKITFSPLVCTNLDLSVQPANENWAQYIKKDGILFDPSQPVEAELLEYVLETGLGASEMQRLKDEAAKQKSKKRKTVEPEASGESQATVISSQEQSLPIESTQGPTKKRKTSNKEAGSSTVTKRKGKKKDDGVDSASVPEEQPPPARRGFRLPTALLRYGSMNGRSDQSVSQNSQGASQSSAESQQKDRVVPSFPTSPSTPTIQRQPQPSRQCDMTENLIPPSSQTHPHATSWSSSHEPGSTSVSKAAQRMRRIPSPPDIGPGGYGGPATGPGTPDLSSAVPRSSIPSTAAARAPLASRAQVITIDLSDDDEDEIPPAPIIRAPTIPSAPKTTSNTPHNSAEPAPNATSLPPDALFPPALLGRSIFHPAASSATALIPCPRATSTAQSRDPAPAQQASAETEEAKRQREIRAARLRHFEHLAAETRADEAGKQAVNEVSVVGQSIARAGSESHPDTIDLTLDD